MEAVEHVGEDLDRLDSNQTFLVVQQLHDLRNVLLKPWQFHHIHPPTTTTLHPHPPNPFISLPATIDVVEVVAEEVDAVHADLVVRVVADAQHGNQQARLQVETYLP